MQSVQSRPYGKQLDFERATRAELLSTCLRNCANSFRVLAMQGQNEGEKGAMVGRMETLPSYDSYRGNVIVLLIHTPRDWLNDDVKKNEKVLRDAGRDNWTLFQVADLHRSLIELLAERGELDSSKIPRSLID